MTPPLASVVVPVYNAAATIGPCLASLLALRCPRDRCEIVVVDNRSTDGSVDAIRSFGSDVRLLFESARGAAAARNRGVREARGSLIAFTDADCVVDPDWLLALVEPLADPAVGAVGGRILSATPNNRIERFGESIHDQKSAIEVFNPPYVITMNWGSRRQVLLDSGLFDEALLRGQDVDLAWRLHRAGFGLVYQPDAIVRHRNEHTVWGLMHEGFVHGYHGVRVRAKHSALGMSSVQLQSEVRARLFDHLRRLARIEDRIQTALWLLFDLGKPGASFWRSRVGRVQPGAATGSFGPYGLRSQPRTEAR